MSALHLRYAGASAEEQERALKDFVRASPRLMQVLTAVRGLNLPDWWIVSGAIYNTVWNALTDRADMYGVKDIDLFYFDANTSYEAEDRVIRRVEATLPGTPPVETRNQARVHLWFEERFGHPYPQLVGAADGIEYFSSRTHAVGLRLERDDSLTLHAPFGLDDIFSFRLVPNTRLANRQTYESRLRASGRSGRSLTTCPGPMMRRP